MPYNPQIHHRQSIRLKGYDYAQAGLYFITICCQNRAHFFGHIKNGEMVLNDAGKMVEHWYYELENKFHDIKCREMVVMPNHFHCIVQNVGPPVGADLRVCPDNAPRVCPNSEPNSDPRICPDNDNETNILGGSNMVGEHNILGEHVGSPLRAIVQWFKTMTTNHYIRGVKQNGWERFDGKLWQRNYWEHIIRNENEYHRISKYIINNPAQWKNDKLK